MNNPEPLVPHILKWEGEFGGSANDASSSMYCPTPVNGKYYHTHKGITYRTWVGVFGKYKNQRWIQMNHEDWMTVFRSRFWGPCGGDKLPYESIAYFAVEIGWLSGSERPIKEIQKAVNKLLGRNELSVDGSLGPLTLKAIASVGETELFDALYQARKSFFLYITSPENSSDPKTKAQYQKNKVYLKGWNNRLDSFYKKFRK